MRGREAFPASPGLLMEFLLEGSTSKSAIYHIWLAISDYHERSYWHTDANPVQWLSLHFGVRVSPRGDVQLPDTAFIKEALGAQTWNPTNGWGPSVV